jgi:hypothetical protein
LKNIENWTKEVDEGISVLPSKDIEQFKKKQQKEKKILITVMTHLRDVKQIKDITLNLFPGMKDTIHLLKKHIEHVEMEPNVDYNLKCDTAKMFLTEVSDKAMR